ncbi:MAG: hypothetical protein RL318_2626 [Fibrobacterota bacterium]|jgi:transcriptional regulatory protein RtcR
MRKASEPRRRIGIGILGNILDSGKKHWRPTVDLARHEEPGFDQYHLLHLNPHKAMAELVAADMVAILPTLSVNLVELPIHNAWDFEAVYATLMDVARKLSLDASTDEVYVHLTTGSHVQQICLFLLTEARFFPGKILQTNPPRGPDKTVRGRLSIIDLDLSRYNSIAARFKADTRERTDLLKDGIRTKDKAFNALIEKIEVVALRSRDPILLGGPTGSGKSRLARRIHEMRRMRSLVHGEFVAVNCATLAGEGAMSALFGHVKGAFTGAQSDRAGYLRAADKGVLFLDEIGELGLEEQAMLLTALEEKRFRPVGSDREMESDFLLLAGSHKDLAQEVAKGSFREDLLARIRMWHFVLPGLAQRPLDLEPNLDFELERLRNLEGRQISMTREARDAFLAWGTSAQASWRGNFRDLSAAVTRMALLSDGRIGLSDVKEEIQRLMRDWTGYSIPSATPLPSIVGEIDLFDQAQLAQVLEVCKRSASLAEAGRTLFAVTRRSKESPNDSDRLRKYLARFGLSWSEAIGQVDS